MLQMLELKKNCVTRTNYEFCDSKSIKRRKNENFYHFQTSSNYLRVIIAVTLENNTKIQTSTTEENITRGYDDIFAQIFTIERMCRYIVL